ncbi:MAG TPA: hypothetical protein VNO20_04975 [Solirubrobacterales bacterium]|nr:hypothetical protein [Solirubrobacterales bacterium]
MSDHWEYKLILWTSSTWIETKTIDLPLGVKSQSPTQFWKSTFRITQSGKKPETRLCESSSEADNGVERMKIEELLAEFGAQGWELVSETVQDTAVVGNQHGWPEVGTPIQIRWTMKRRAAP